MPPIIYGLRGSSRPASIKRRCDGDAAPVRSTYTRQGARLLIARINNWHLGAARAGWLPAAQVSLGGLQYKACSMSRLWPPLQGRFSSFSSSSDPSEEKLTSSVCATRTQRVSGGGKPRKGGAVCTQAHSQASKHPDEPPAPAGWCAHADLHRGEPSLRVEVLGDRREACQAQCDPDDHQGEEDDLVTVM